MHSSNVVLKPVAWSQLTGTKVFLNSSCPSVLPNFSVTVTLSHYDQGNL